MTHQRKRPERRFLSALVALAGLGFTAPAARAELLVNSVAERRAGPEHAEAGNFQPCAAAAAQPTGELLDGLFYPPGLLLAVGFYPPSGWVPGWLPTPVPAGNEPPPGDPTITISVPMPTIVPPQSVTSTTSIGPSTPPGSPPGSPPGNPGGPQTHPSPEPATFVSGMLGMSLLSWFGWRRRRS